MGFSVPRIVWFFGFGVILLAVAAAHGQTPTDVTHSQLQELRENPPGSGNWVPDPPQVDPINQVRFTGVVLNSPADMLDSTYVPDAILRNIMGAQWQVAIQSLEPINDHAGTVLWMGQNYASLPIGNGSYDEGEWAAEMERLNFPEIGAVGKGVWSTVPLKPGDRVEVVGAAGMGYRGKFNINEEHDINPANDFHIAITGSGPLPAAIPLSLSALKDAGNSFIFDGTRQTGCERYQTQLVELQNVQLVPGYDWGPEKYATIQDGSRTFLLHLGRHSWFSPSNPVHVEPPGGQFSVTGILFQESTMHSPGVWNQDDGYELWVMDPLAIENSRVRIDEGGTLDLDGSQPAFFAGAGRSVDVLNDSDAGGLIVAAAWQQLGDVTGTGKTTIAAGGELTASCIRQNSVVLAGESGNPARLIIRPSGSSQVLFAERLRAAQGVVGGGDGGQQVPEPGTLFLLAAAGLAATGRYWWQRYRGRTSV